MAKNKLDNEPKAVLKKNSIACPIAYALNIIVGKWKLPIICTLSQHEMLRYGQLKKAIPGITNMMLSQSLHELQEDDIIQRVQYMEIPPRVEYSMTSAGKSLLPALEMLAQWGNTQVKMRADKLQKK